MKIHEVSVEVWTENLISAIKDQDFYWAVDRLLKAKKNKEWVKLGFTVKNGEIKARSFEGTEIFNK